MEDNELTPEAEAEVASFTQSLQSDEEVAEATRTLKEAIGDKVSKESFVGMIAWLRKQWKRFISAAKGRMTEMRSNRLLGEFIKCFTAYVVYIVGYVAAQVYGPTVVGVAGLLVAVLAMAYLVYKMVTYVAAMFKNLDERGVDGI